MGVSEGEEGRGRSSEFKVGKAREAEGLSQRRQRRKRSRGIWKEVERHGEGRLETGVMVERVIGYNWGKDLDKFSYKWDRSECRRDFDVRDVKTESVCLRGTESGGI